MLLLLKCAWLLLALLKSVSCTGLSRLSLHTAEAAACDRISARFTSKWFMRCQQAIIICCHILFCCVRCAAQQRVCLHFTYFLFGKILFSPLLVHLLSPSYWHSNIWHLDVVVVAASAITITIKTLARLLKSAVADQLLEPH